MEIKGPIGPRRCFLSVNKINFVFPLLKLFLYYFNLLGHFQVQKILVSFQGVRGGGGGGPNLFSRGISNTPGMVKFRHTLGIKTHQQPPAVYQYFALSEK